MFITKNKPPHSLKTAKMPKGTRFSLTDYQTMVDRVESHRKGKTEKGTLTANGAIAASPIAPQKQNKYRNHVIETKDGIEGECKIKIKPLSVNEGYTGKRWKTPAHRIWEKAVLMSLPNYNIPEPPYCLHFKFGLSNIASDGDNCMKFLQDCLAKRYGFNDKKIKRWIVDVDDCQKDEEYFSFKIESLK